MFIDEAINVYASFIDKPVNILHKPIYVSYIEVTMPLYRIEAIRYSLTNNNSMYITAGFAYYLKDIFLSLMLWNHSYECVVLPIIVGEHYRGNC